MPAAPEDTGEYLVSFSIAARKAQPCSLMAVLYWASAI